MLWLACSVQAAWPALKASLSQFSTADVAFTLQTFPLPFHQIAFTASMGVCVPPLFRAGVDSRPCSEHTPSHAGAQALREFPLARAVKQGLVSVKQAAAGQLVCGGCGNHERRLVGTHRLLAL